MISPNCLIELTTHFPSVLAASLEIIDHGKVTRFVTTSTDKPKREFYRVKEPTSKNGFANNQSNQLSGDYFDIIGDHCWCFFYAKQCLTAQGGSSLLCKHVLAVKIAQALAETHSDKVQEKRIDEHDFAPLVLSSKLHLNKFEEKRNSAGSFFN
jgi:hypothetical protein